MARVFFEEKQTMRQVVWIWWIIVPVSTSIILSILYGLYWQLIMDEPWGTEPMSDAGLLIAALVSIMILGFVIWILLSVQLDTKIDKEGISFRYFPHMRRFTFLVRGEIQQYEVRKLSFLESRRRGYRRSLSGRQKRLLVYGRHALILGLKTGKKFTIGTQKPAELEAAMKRMISASETE